MKMLFFDFKAALALLAVVALSGGCGVLSKESYTRTEVYDLGIPNPMNNTGIRFSVGRIKMDGPYKTKMVLRREGNRLSVNEYARWASSPETMLSRYLKMALAPVAKKRSGIKGQLTIEGTILVFEVDEPTRSVLLQIDYRLAKNEKPSDDSTIKARFSTKVAKITSASVAKAMSENAAKLAKRVMDDAVSKRR